MHFLYLAICALLVCAHSRRHNQIGYTQDEWNVMEFGFNSEEDREHAAASGNLIPTNAVPIDVQPHYIDETNYKVFVTIPKFQGGIPYTLATVTREMGANGSVLKPYPSYADHNNKNGTNCDAITSAFRVAVTECNHLWVIDSGSVGSDAQCPPQLLVFDLNNDKLIHRYRFKSSLYTPGASLFITPVVVVRDPPPRGNCSAARVYVADVNFHGLVVYDTVLKNAWRIENRFMYPDPNHGIQYLAGERFNLMDGIFGMATDKKNLYFHPFSSKTEYSVPLTVVDDSTLFENNLENMGEEFIRLGTRRSACTVSAMDSNDNLYCITMDPIKLVIWNVNTQYYSYNEIPLNSRDYQFVSGMKVVKNPKYGIEELWMISNRYQKAAAGTRNFNEVNFRIKVIPLPIKRISNRRFW